VTLSLGCWGSRAHLGISFPWCEWKGTNSSLTCPGGGCTLRGNSQNLGTGESICALGISTQPSQTKISGYWACTRVAGRRLKAYRKLWGVVMLAKCSNPSCSASFLSLQYGRLYRLDRDAKTRPSMRRVEYYWLCEHCAPIMTMQLEDDGNVEAISLPAGPPIARTNFLERKRGLLLRSINSRISGDGRVGMRRPGIDIRDVA